MTTSEHLIQSAFIQWVRIAEKQDDRLKLLFSVPNGGVRHIGTSMKLKAEGARPGVPDIMLPVPKVVYDNEKSSVFIGLAIEFKSAKGRVSQAQGDYLDLLTKHGWVCAICTTPESAIKTVKDYLK